MDHQYAQYSQAARNIDFFTFMKTAVVIKFNIFNKHGFISDNCKFIHGRLCVVIDHVLNLPR